MSQDLRPYNDRVGSGRLVCEGSTGNTPDSPALLEEVVMRRKTFDALLTTGGVVLAAVLVVAGVLGLWAHNFVDQQVKTQLAQQQIFFPAAGSEAISDPAIKPYLTQYAGQQMTNG